ncbi:D-alanyl-D-alanine carboxypeptidase/D-alanyl-D-alanine-endopeptidase [Streptomyces sp. NPDC002896]|uniref:D-alanyl-D-alanine carboxypeptidase/D-alanyl-D-alanine endopeptidase n=1 Tax=Streptomyces sp. NPDC002896 TaxID=3154438 RepID=UPI003327D394
MTAGRFARRCGVRFAKLATWQLTAGAAVVGLALAAGSVAAAGPWDSGQRTAERDRAAALEDGGGADHGNPASRKDAADGTGGTDARARKTPAAAPSAPSVLAALGASTGSAQVPEEHALAKLLDPLLDSGSLGPQRTAAVVDAATGKQLYGKAAGQALTPASTTKIATAVAVLTAAGPDHRITTRAVIEPGSAKDAKVVLVGGGDPTLTARKDAKGNASLRTLADDTARALKAKGVDEISLGYDTSLYSGPLVHPIGLNSNIAPVSALMTDEGRLDDSASGPAPRSGDPAADAARTFANLLRDRGIKTETTDPSSAKATDRAEQLAAVQSPTLSALVERMLTNSDNDIAEALSRQAALATDEPASFDGGAKAIGKQLKKLKLPLTGAQFADGSGLNRADRLSASLLTALLARAADPDHPELRPVLTGLPVAGFTGTLRNRYADAADALGTGLVRAKTGTLTGVNTLAGTVADTDGRLLVFAFMTTGTTDPQTAQSTLDRAASALAGCGCS